MGADPYSPAERVLRRDVEDQGGRPLSARARQSARSLESYLGAGVRPRWMERLMQIEREIARLRRELAAGHRELSSECGGDPAEFARRWRERAGSVPFDEVNDLIRRHNEWYPVERDLPVDPRTGEYRVRHLRRELDAEWVLGEFPAVPAP